VSGAAGSARQTLLDDPATEGAIGAALAGQLVDGEVGMPASWCGGGGHGYDGTRPRWRLERLVFSRLDVGVLDLDGHLVRWAA
jgi:hypothetical protein